MRALIAAVVVSGVLAVQPAAAATTVFAASVYNTGGTVVLPGNAVGPADGGIATILRVAGGSQLTLQLSQAISGLNTIINGQRLTANSNVQIAIGEVIGATAVFSANIALPAGLASLHTLDLSTACAGVSAAGCSLLRFSVNGAPGGAFLLDGVSGVASAPEPRSWALMLIGFGAVAWRMKNRRRATQYAFAS